MFCELLGHLVSGSFGILRSVWWWEIGEDLGDFGHVALDGFVKFFGVFKLLIWADKFDEFDADVLVVEVFVEVVDVDFEGA